MTHLHLARGYPDCMIAGCGRKALYLVTRKIDQTNTDVPVCRKCAAELTSVWPNEWQWKGHLHANDKN